MTENMTVFYRFCKNSQILYFLHSILCAIVDWNDQKLEQEAWDFSKT